MIVTIVDKSLDKNPRTGSFYNLKFFEDLNHVCEFIAEETKRGLYVRDLWSTYTQHKLPINIEYHCVTNNISHITIHRQTVDYAEGKLLYTIKPDPTDNLKRWIVFKESI